jgi:methylated-DNA-protein-cysteine methyltransferase-like protein
VSSAPRENSKARSSALEADSRVQRILAVIDSIPEGRVASYGDVAREAILPRHARLVGRVLSRLPSGSKLAWHRVVDAAGKIRVGGASAREQKRRLAREGVVVSPKNRVNPDLFTFAGRRDRHGARRPPVA